MLDFIAAGGDIQFNHQNRWDPYIECTWMIDHELHREGGPAYVFATADHAEFEQGWYFQGKAHRDGGPAVCNEYSESWYQNGEFHRDDEPALTEFDKKGVVLKEWFQHGVRFRKGNLPAFESKKETIWYNPKGQKHKEDGPAIVRKDGSKEWWQNGLLHRANGPAITDKHGQKKYYYQGQHFKHQSTFDNHILQMRIQSIEPKKISFTP